MLAVTVRAGLKLVQHGTVLLQVTAAVTDDTHDEFAGLEEVFAATEGAGHRAVSRGVIRVAANVARLVGAEATVVITSTVGAGDSASKLALSGDMGGISTVIAGKRHLR